MPVLKKEMELNDGTKIWVKQASGMAKLNITNIQAKVFREMRHAGEPSEWTEEQNAEFAEQIEAAGGGMQAQIEQWIPKCVITEDFDIDTLTFEELQEILFFVRGDDSEGAVPL